MSHVHLLGNNFIEFLFRDTWQADVFVVGQQESICGIRPYAKSAVIEPSTVIYPEDRPLANGPAGGLALFRAPDPKAAVHGAGSRFGTSHSASVTIQTAKCKVKLSG
jgi:hypothetical protein